DDSGCEEVVRLVAGCLGRGEPERLHELREQGELLEELVVELAAALVALEGLMPVSRNLERVPAHEHGAWLLAVPQTQQEVREADDRVRRPAVGAPDRLWQRVVSAVRERVAVDHEQGTFHREASSSWIAAISRSVASRAAGAISRPRR